MVQVLMTEAEEVRFLKHILDVLRRNRLAPELFPELSARAEGGSQAYYVAFYQALPQIAEEIILEFFKYENERRDNPGPETVGGVV